MDTVVASGWPGSLFCHCESILWSKGCLWLIVSEEQSLTWQGQHAYLQEREVSQQRQQEVGTTLLLQSLPSVMYFLQQDSTPKGPVAFPNSTTVWEPSIQTHVGNFMLKPQQIWFVP